MKKVLLFSFIYFLIFFQVTVASPASPTSVLLEKEGIQNAYIDDLDSSLDFSNSFSIESWVKLESVPAIGENYSILTQWNALSKGFVYTYTHYPIVDVIALRLEVQSGVENKSYEKIAPYLLEVGRWHHLAVTYDAIDGVIDMYIDGDLIAHHTDIANVLNDSNADIHLGLDDPGDARNLFDGEIDEMRVWNYARSQEQIVGSMNDTLVGDETGLQAYWKFDNNLLDSSQNQNHLIPINSPTFVTDIIEETSFDDVWEQLIKLIDSSASSKGIKNSYVAHVKKLLNFYEDSKFEVVANQIEAFLKKLSKDVEQGKVDEEIAEPIEELGDDLLEKISESTEGPGVPLMTQVASPHPPESSKWADDTYAWGDEYWCGTTIAGCGCAITSLSMLAKSHGLNVGLDGEDINPGSLNAWLQENNGYSANGNVIWNYALGYFSDTPGFSNLTFDYHNETSESLIDSYVDRGDLAVAFKKKQGHYFLLTDVLPAGGYMLNDPLWYETKTTSGTKDVDNNLQDYGGSIDQANLFSFHNQQKALPSWIEIYLGSPAELLITDEQGRRTGYEPDSGKILLEIPGSSYSRAEGVVSQDEYGEEVHLEKVLMVKQPQSNIYALKVIGTGVGDYDLTVTTSGGEGQYEWEYIADSTSVGEEDDFAVDVADTTGASNAVGRLRELADLKDVTKPEVASKLRNIANRLEAKNVAVTDFEFISEL